MRTSACLKIFLALLLCLSPTLSLAQAVETTDCDQLLASIERLEKMDIKVMSASLRHIYKESLLALYTQRTQCLTREISATNDALKTAANPDAATGFESKLRALTKEKSDTADKIALLNTALNLAAANAGAPGPVANAAPQSLPAAVADTPRAPTETTTRGSLRTGRGRATAVPLSPVPTTGAATVVASAPTAPVAAATTSSCASGATYDDAPGLLKDLVAGLATEMVNSGSGDAADQAGPQMVLYTVFDAASETSSRLVRNLESYHYLGETARTDKQLGASAKSAGAVSAIEKPGFARLLGFAIERGGITKMNDGTNLTLSTSLYSLYAIGNKDTAESYARAGVLNRVALAASFAVDDQDNELANARRNNLSEWSGKVRLFGDRSTRSPQFQRFFDQEIRPLIRARLRSLGTSIEQLATRVKDQQYDALEDEALDGLPALVEARMKCPDYIAATTNAQKEKLVGNVLLSRMRTGVFDAVRSGRLSLGADTVALIEGEFLPGLKRSLDNLVLADKLLKKRFAELQTGPLGTFAYTNHRQPNLSDYSETKFLFEQDKSAFLPLKLTANFGLSIYHRPDATRRQEKLRDVSAAISFEGASRSPFTEDENLSKITYSFTGRYERLFENRRMANRKPDLASVQFLMELPLLKGFSLPFSLNYSNATEEERKKNVKFNFGMRLDTDKLFDILGAAANR